MSSKDFKRKEFVEKIKMKKFGFQVGKSVILCQLLQI
jgi:hypothetical protein